MMAFAMVPASAQWSFIINLDNAIPYPNTNETVAKICFLSSDTAYYASNYSGIHNGVYTIYKTVDGWNTMKKMYSEGENYDSHHLYDMIFLNETIGYKLSGGMFSGVYKTTNSASTWNEVPNNTSTYLITHIAYPKEDLGFYIERRSYSSPMMNVIASDSGNCTINPLSDAYRNGYALNFINDSTGFMLCRDTTQNYICIQTTDSARTWQEVLISATDQLKNIQFISPNNGFIFSKNGIVYKSTDGGGSWSPLPAGVSQSVNSSYFVNDTLGYLACDGGVIMKTNDGGSNWQTQNTGSNYKIIQVYFADDGTGYCLDSEDNLYKALPTGLGWAKISGSTDDFLQIYPNPTEEMITVQLNAMSQSLDAFNVHIYNHLGKVVSQKSVYNGSNQMDVSHLSPGIYFLRVEGVESTMTKRFIKL